MISYSVSMTADPKHLVTACSAAEKILAIQVLKDTRPFVPALGMSLNQRSHIALDKRSTAVGNHVIYPGPYARYLYVGKVMVDSETGKGPRKIPDVGYRFRRGATLVATDRNLNYTRTVHPRATDHWIEKSAKVNMQKWERVAKEAVKAYGR